MKLFIKGMTRNKLSFLLTMLLCGTVSYVNAMKRPFKGEDKGSVLKKQKTEEQIQNELQQHLTGLKADEFFVFQEGTADGTVVSKSILELSQTMQHLLEYVDENNQKLIPLPYSANLIKSFFDFVIMYTMNPSQGLAVFKVHSLSFCIELANIASYLDIRTKILEAIVNHLSEMLKKIDYSTLSSNDAASLDTLNPDIKKQIVYRWVKPCMELLGSDIMIEGKKELPENFELGIYSRDENKFIFKLEAKRLNLIDMTSTPIVIQRLNNRGSFTSADFSVNNDTLVIGYNKSSDKNAQFIVWKFENNKFIQKNTISLSGESLELIKISPAGNLVATLSDEKIFLWDISDPDKAVSIELKDKKYTGDDTFLTMDFCSDNKTLFTGCAGRLSEHGLIEWDVSNLHEIKRKEVTGEHQQHINILSVACSPNGKMYASGAEGEEDNLLLWDNVANEYYILQGHSSDVDSLMFTYDSKILVSESDFDQKNNFIIWDIRDVNAVTRYYLPGYSSFLPHSMSISGNTIICQYSDDKKYVIPVLSLRQLLLLDVLKECDFMQAQVIVRIIGQVEAGSSIRFKDQELKVFMTLPENIRNLMIKAFNIQFSK